jgi:DNA-binding NarL/FixJ family response regulator
MVLEAEPDIVVVGEAATSDEARDAALALRPDLLLLDLRMPGSAAPSVCADVLAASPETHVVVLSTFDDDSDVRAMMDAGASGYLLKDVQPDTLARSIRNIADGSPTAAW